MHLTCYKLSLSRLLDRLLLQAEIDGLIGRRPTCLFTTSIARQSDFSSTCTLSKDLTHSLKERMAQNHDDMDIVLSIMLLPTFERLTRYYQTKVHASSVLVSSLPPSSLSPVVSCPRLSLLCRFSLVSLPAPFFCPPLTFSFPPSSLTRYPSPPSFLSSTSPILPSSIVRSALVLPGPVRSLPLVPPPLPSPPLSLLSSPPRRLLIHPPRHSARNLT
ncbi:hypothetical protein B0H19DRAFT_1272025 [Mycena capillaripes]|nr:hypothetical protein B0H19DRAFT_1272025 [Mycena capillaripes]